MKRFLLSFVLVFLSFHSVFAQKDTDHWIAPYYASTSSYTNRLYLSTDATTPVAVNVFSNNVQLNATPIMISKNSPQTYDINLSDIAATTAGEAQVVLTKGLYIKGSSSFYCTLRIAQSAHGEIVTSKGKAGIGKEFYVANTPSPFNSSSNNFTAGVMATENGTTVTATWNAGVTFLGTAPTGTTQTVTLNKGQSFIFAGNGATASNLQSFIGAKIVADKPITLTNGNINGNFGTGSSSGSDAILDQSVPTERLGSTFAMVRTLSSTSDLEGGIVIATENNTQIFLNGATTPVATINQGQWYRISGDAYQLQGANGHYNMLVSTSKNVYLYQLVSVGNSNATCGFNYIPPLNCFLPRKIDEIGNVNQMPNITSTVTLKLNIITEAGATVTVNGVAPTATQGPYPLTGNANWVTYAVEGVTGNLTIQSNKAVTAGINGGYSTAGYGGYFAGFNSVPVIAKQTGDCIPGIILEVDDSYDTYQWNLNGAPIAGATSHTYTPTAAGNYTVTVGMGTCTPITTIVYKVFTCLKETTQSVNACASKVITPTFTSSTQTPVASTVTILTQPTNGIATINPTTGAITYIPNAGFLGTDTIVYQFCGNATEFVDCEKVTLTMNVVPFILTDTTIKACQYSGNGFFDLTTALVTTYSPVVKKFYPTLNDLNNNTNQITNPTNYFSGGGSVYVQVTTSEGCIGTAKITLEFYPVPVVNDATLTVCFLELNETKGEFDLTSANVSSQSPITKKYYPSFVDASNGTNEILTPADQYISGNGTVYVRVYSDFGCYAIAKITLVVTPPKRSSTLVDKYICIDDRTSLDAGPGYQSYQWSTGATTQQVTGLPVGTYWVILQHNNCYVKQFVNIKKSQNPVITSIDISNNTATVNVSGGVPAYKYAVDGTTNWQDSNVFTGLSRGQHVFYVKDALDCTPIAIELTVPNLINAITPNGDNTNDYLDYSELKYKENLSFVIYDRYGNKIFTGDKFNDFKWDGKFFEKKIPTGTYWYHINWNEPNEAKTPIKYTGWILVKNRE